jgi:hypothetical protein
MPRLAPVTAITLSVACVLTTCTLFLVLKDSSAAVREVSAGRAEPPSARH